ncbi:MAG: hypothetical protein ACYTEL_01790, partial [Planctomycetota bacterium]
MWTKHAYLVALVSILLLAANASAEPDPVGWWKFDEGTGSDVNDSSINGNHGTILLSVSWVPGQMGPY